MSRCGSLAMSENGAMVERWPFEAVLFDMDGTLVDSSHSVERAWVTVATELGLDVLSVVKVCHGRPAPATLRQFLPEASVADIALAAGRQLELQYTDLADVEPMSGLPDVLTMLAETNMPWAVVTSADRRLANVRLEFCGIDPSVVVTADDVTEGKPHPAGYLLAAARLGVPIGRCLVVEDSTAGVEAGRRAGASVAALNGLECDFPIETLVDLTMLLSRGGRTS
jgi:HAD superfamily hydrolase (TIGR01509 family)